MKNYSERKRLDMALEDAVIGMDNKTLTKFLIGTVILTPLVVSAELIEAGYDIVCSIRSYICRKFKRRGK